MLDSIRDHLRSKGARDRSPLPLRPERGIAQSARENLFASSEIAELHHSVLECDHNTTLDIAGTTSAGLNFQLRETIQSVPNGAVVPRLISLNLRGDG